MKKCILILCLLLSACINTVTYSHRQNWVDVYVARCNGSFVDISLCYRQASQACNGNFEVLNASVENAGTVNNMSVQTGMTPMLYGTQDNVLNRSIMFYCK